MDRVPHSRPQLQSFRCGPDEGSARRSTQVGRGSEVEGCWGKVLTLEDSRYAGLILSLLVV